MVSACKTEKAPEPNDPKPTIQILNPVPHAYYNSGDTIPLLVQINDNNSLRFFIFDVYEADLAFKLLHLAITFKESISSYSLDTFIVAHSTEVVQYELVAAATDQGGNSEIAHLHCHILP